VRRHISECLSHEVDKLDGSSCTQLGQHVV
jgi:hypothetical protein